MGDWEQSGSVMEAGQVTHSSHYHQPSSTYKVKFFFLSCFLSQNCVGNGISLKGNKKKWKRNGMMDQKAKKM
jgi:hypothetical protein